MRNSLLLILLSPPMLLAQTDVLIQLNWEKLGEAAVERVEVNLDGPLLQTAAAFLSDRDPDEAYVKKLIAGLQGIYIHSYEYENDQQSAGAAIDAVRDQLKQSNWGRIVQAVNKDGNHNAEIYVRISEKEITGVLVLAVEPREVTVVQIVGRIDPEDVGKLRRKLGIPRFRFRKI